MSVDESSEAEEVNELQPLKSSDQFVELTPEEIPQAPLELYQLIASCCVGSFFEFYGVNNNIEKIGNPEEVAELLNIQLTRRNKAVMSSKRREERTCLNTGFH